MPHMLSDNIYINQQIIHTVTVHNKQLKNIPTFKYLSIKNGNFKPCKIQICSNYVNMLITATKSKFSAKENTST